MKVTEEGSKIQAFQIATKDFSGLLLSKYLVQKALIVYCFPESLSSFIKEFFPVILICCFQSA